MNEATITFNPYRAVWERLDRDQRAAYGSSTTFYDLRANSVDAGADTEAVSEHKWLRSGKPYYKLWPAYALMLSRTSLDIPAELFHAPHDAFAICLPVAPQLFQQVWRGESMAIRSILVSVAGHAKRPNPCLAMVIDTGTEWRIGGHIELVPGRSIESSMRDAPGAGDVPLEMIATGLRLAIAVSLLAVSVHRCIEHDVIAALRDRYDRATTTEEREQLAEKSRRRGLNGWCIGRGRCLSLVTRCAGDDSLPTGRELTYQHIRGGHFHTVRLGPGKSMAKVMFYEPTVVRPDLPPPPLEVARVG